MHVRLISTACDKDESVPDLAGQPRYFDKRQRATQHDDLGPDPLNDFTSAIGAHAHDDQPSRSERARETGEAD